MFAGLVMAGGAIAVATTARHGIRGKPVQPVIKLGEPEAIASCAAIVEGQRLSSIMPSV